MTSPGYGPLTQVAWVTDRIEATERSLTEVCGAGRWTRMLDIDFSDGCEFRSAPADFTAHISLTYIADMQLELIQPVRGASIYSEFLDRNGPGLHHICFEPDDYDGALTAAVRSGIAIPQQGDMGYLRFAYLDCASAGVPYIEIADIRPDTKAMYADIKRKAHARR